MFYRMVAVFVALLSFSFSQTLNDDFASGDKSNMDPNASGEIYSSFQCIGGTQKVDTNSMQHTHKKYPVNDPETRTCLLRNVCVVNGDLNYFVSSTTQQNLPADFLPESFGDQFFMTGHLRGFTIPITTTVGPLPVDLKVSSSEVTFLDANSWSFNYGHYLNDNVIPMFTAAKVFNLRFNGSQQLLETKCQKFSTLGEDFTTRLVDYDRSMGTYQQACLDKMEGMRSHFFDVPPIYFSDLQDQRGSLCFPKLIVGAGRTFGLLSMDLSRAILLREFRDYVIARLSQPPPEQKDIILIAQRTTGSAGGQLIDNLCDQVREKASNLKEEYEFVCIVPSELPFEEEVRHVQRAKILVSMHGTVSYMSLFSRDFTQQVVIGDPEELKENQILWWATHFTTYYLTWNRMHDLGNLLAFASDNFKIATQRSL